ncbi:MAG: hypothetical protein WCO25_03250 [Candidatus Uhrbacteria bacterium]
MLTLLHLFEVQENNSLRGLPEGVPIGHTTLFLYRALLSEFLEGTDRLRVRGELFGFWTEGREDAPRSLMAPTRKLVDAIRANDPMVAELLLPVPTDPIEEDRAEYAIVYPSGLTPAVATELATKLAAASDACPAVAMPAEIDRAWRRVFSQVSAAHGIAFADVRPKTAGRASELPI